MPRLTEPIATSYARGAGMADGRISGTRDVAAILGVSRQRVGQIARTDPSFPRRATTISGGPLWYTAGIEVWIAAHRPGAVDRGRNPFAGEAADVLRAAEEIARRREDGYVAELHLWRAMADSPSGRIVSGVFATLGVDLAELRRATGLDGLRVDQPSQKTRLTPHVQRLLERAARRVAASGRPVTSADIAIAFIDGDERYRGRRHDHLLDYVERRGLDVAELRRRLDAVVDDPAAAAGFERRALTKRRPAHRRPRRPAGIELARNPLGHDPWDLSSGAAFAVREDGRSLVIDGEQWFFRIDGDGFFVRTTDGHPVGYRYRVDPPPRRGRGNPRPVNGFMEVLPMPPADIARWPDHRYRRDE